MHVTALLLARRDGDPLDRVVDAVAGQTRGPDAVLVVTEHAPTGAPTGDPTGDPTDQPSHPSADEPTGAHPAHREPFGRLPGARLVHLGPDDLHPASSRAVAALDDAPADAPEGAPGAARDAASGGGARPSAPGRGHATTEWVWLLQDGAAPAPDALDQLVRAVERGPSVGVLGCKQRDASGRRLLLEAGSTTSRWGRRMTGVEPGDVDQGQLDHRDDVLAVSTAGMLVDHDLLRRLGGTDPTLGSCAAALDLCRRARLAGRRVVVVPPAVVETDEPAVVTRRETAHLRLVGAHPALLPLLYPALLVGALARLLVRVAAKEPGRGAEDLRGTLAALLRVDRVWRGRRRAAATRTRPRAELRPLQTPTGEVLRWHRERWHLRRARSRPAPATDGARGDRWRGLLPVGGLVVALAVVSALALHRLVGPGAVSGGALAVPPASLGDLWAAATSAWRPAGLGTAAAADPLHLVLAAVAALTGGSPRLAVTLLWLLALPLAGAGAWGAAGTLTRSRALRAWAGVVWAGAPALVTALDQGRLGPVLAHVALPYALWGAVSAVRAPLVRYAWAPAAGAGLALAVVLAGAPVLVPAAVLLVAVAAARHRSRAAALLWTLLPAAVLLGPWWVDALTSPRALVGSPGTPTAFEPAPAWWQLLGHPAEPASWPALSGTTATVVVAVASGTVLLPALLALLRSGSAGAIARWGWGLVLLGLTTGVLASRVDVALDLGTTVRSWPGPALGGVLAGLLVAGVAGADGVTARRRSRDAGSAADGDVAGAAAPVPAAAAPTDLADATRLADPTHLADPTDPTDPTDATDAKAAGTASGSGAGGRLRRRWRPVARWFGRTDWRWLGIVLVAAVAVAGPVAGLAAWTWQSGAGDGASPVHRSASELLPAVAADAAVSPDRVRSLVLHQRDGEVVAALVRGRGAGTDEASTVVAARLVPDPGGRAGASVDGSQPEVTDRGLRALDDAVVALVTGAGDPRPALADLGVGYVLLRSDDPERAAADAEEVADPEQADPEQADDGSGPGTVPAPAGTTAPAEEDADLVRVLDATVGLTRSGQTEAAVAWRVVAPSGGGRDAADRPAAVRLLDGEGTQVAVVPSDGVAATAELPPEPGQEARTVVLAERADAGWVARLDGRRLEPALHGGWAQAFDVGADGGRLVVEYVDPWQPVWRVAQAVVLLLAVLLAAPLPGGRRRGTR
ncbi:glycosyltransferase [Thalassiella azotivora]